MLKLSISNFQMLFKEKIQMQANVCFAPLLLENDPLLTFSGIFISRFLNEAKVFLQSNVNRTALFGYLFL